ncbi:MAG: zonular occludens toxin domain-containing protein [Clostridia bacterium]
MISLYSGTPGSGKSLSAAYLIIRCLKRKCNVIANFHINMDYFKKYKKPMGDFVPLDNSEMTVRFLKDYAKENHKAFREHQTLIIIDECAIKFNSRTSMDKDRLEWITFFQQHRKLGFDVVLISQSDKLIDRQIRAFIETEFKHRNLKNYKTFGFILSILFGGFFCQVENWYGMRLKVGHRFFLLNKKKANIYNTYQIFE